MLTRKPAFLGVAVALLAVTGCSSIRRNDAEKHWWQWQKADAPSDSDLATKYGVTVGPQRPKHRGDHLGLKFDHPRVSDFVSKYQTDLRGFYGRALERSGRYLPRIESILRKEGLPTELAYLPLVESGFRPHAVSPAKAVGLWQFIPDTGRRYGLRIDGFVDERRDPIKSTRAAARYLKDLYGMFGDWHLSLAAYNTGEGRISRLLSTSDASDFWELSERGYLFRETEDYVPGFLAALQIASQPEAYGFDRPQPQPLEYDLVHIAHVMPLATVARWTDHPLSTLQELNPALIRGIVPPGGYTIRVPEGTRPLVQQAYARLTPAELLALQRAALPPAPARVCRRKGKRLVCKPKAAANVASKPDLVAKGIRQVAVRSPTNAVQSGTVRKQLKGTAKSGQQTKSGGVQLVSRSKGKRSARN
ncbi:MAG: transglycosylase SLT domain-containing protein [Candidatus Binatia bacterium]|nr:transglycosylase SLT domain-containing protein [Candidatus Binatia bacterium]